MCVIRNNKTDSRATSSFNDWRALEYITETLHLCVWFLLLLLLLFFVFSSSNYIYIYTSISIILKRGAKKIIIFLPYLQRYIYIQYICTYNRTYIKQRTCFCPISRHYIFCSRYFGFWLICVSYTYIHFV